MVAKQNRHKEEAIMISAMPKASPKEIRLFSQKVKIILTEKVLSKLKSVVPSGRVTLRAGSTVTVNFTVINAGQSEEFAFKVSYSDSYLVPGTSRSV